MVRPNDYIEMPVTPQLLTTAQWFANKRILYEYPGYNPRVFGNYGEGHIGTITQGLIGELAVFDYLHEALMDRFGQLEPRQRNQVVRGRLSMDIVLGRADPGHDLLVSMQSLDVKAYGTRRVTRQEIGRLNLLINERELAGREPSQLYVQTFFTTDDHIILAGYHRGLPPLDETFNAPAYACPVRDLSPMARVERVGL